MYPDLSYILHQLFGTPVDNAFSVIQTFGLFLTLAVVTSGFVLYSEFRRYEEEGIFEGVKEKEVLGKGPQILPILINALIGFFLGFKLIYIASDFNAFKADAAGIVLSTEGNLLGGIIGLLVFAGWRYYELHKSKLAEPKIVERIVMPHERVPDITIVAAISGIIGARLFSILENFGDFIKDPLGQLLSGSGLTIYGGLILAFVVVYFYVKKRGIKPIHMMEFTNGM